MAHRDLFIAAYDVACSRRLARALRLTRRYATGGQKSVHEVYLTPAERLRLLADMMLLLDRSTDRFILLRLDPRAVVHTLGMADPPANPDYLRVA